MAAAFAAGMLGHLAAAFVLAVPRTSAVVAAAAAVGSLAAGSLAAGSLLVEHSCADWAAAFRVVAAGLAVGSRPYLAARCLAASAAAAPAG